MRTIERICNQCGNEFNAPLKEVNRGWGKFCSRKCSLDNGRNKMGQIAKSRRLKLDCTTCGKSFSRTRSKAKNSIHGTHFCSRRCKDAGQRIDSGIEMVRPPHYGSTLTNYRSIAFRSYDARCNRCGFSEEARILVVHHIDRDRSNNDASNLEILCPNCHALEHMVQ